MSAQDPTIEAAARLWAMRVHDSAFADWDGFTEWLEQSPDHLAAYETALEEDEWAVDLLGRSEPAPEPATVAPPTPRARRGWWIAAGTGVAATLAAVVGLGIVDRPGTVQQIVTGPGEHRTVALADGSRIVLNGNTHVTIDTSAPREIELAAGEALFDVRHDAAHPFVVTAGKTRLLDAGTVFNVVRDRDALDVAVAEGAVVFEPGPNELRLGPGDAVWRAAPGAPLLVRRMRPQDIGGWQTGELQYVNAPLDQVARDLGRNLGKPVRVERGAARVRFTGTIVLRGAPDEVLARAGPLLGVRFASNGEGWTMSPANGSLR